MKLLEVKTALFISSLIGLGPALSQLPSDQSHCMQRAGDSVLLQEEGSGQTDSGLQVDPALIAQSRRAAKTQTKQYLVPNPAKTSQCLDKMFGDFMKKVRLGGESAEKTFRVKMENGQEIRVQAKYYGIGEIFVSTLETDDTLLIIFLNEKKEPYLLSTEFPELSHLLRAFLKQNHGEDLLNIMVPTNQTNQKPDKSLVPVYRSKTGKLPQITPEKVFRGYSTAKGSIIKDDQQIADETRKALLKLGNLRGTYFIINAGAPHLPGIAAVLGENGIDSHFVVKETHSRLPETLTYFAPAIKKNKTRMNEPIGYASLFDVHREQYGLRGGHSYVLNRDDFPTVNLLKEELHIKRVVYLVESPISSDPLITMGSPLDPTLYDILPRIREYNAAGFEIRGFGVDPRDTEGEYKKAVKTAKRLSELLK